MEAIEYHQFSTKSDVWSYGITLWEIFSLGAIPYGNLSFSQVIMYLMLGTRLACPPGCPNDMYNIMLRCWAANAADRPSFANIVHHIRNSKQFENLEHLISHYAYYTN